MIKPVKKNQSRIAIIGAGIAGLNLARLLSDVADVVVFEKSDKLGGRIATHHANDFSFDHGAQFFTAKNPAFKCFVNTLESLGVVAQWNARFVELEPKGINSQRTWGDEFPHYVGTPAMNSIGQHMANNVDVRFNQLITAIKRIDTSWFVETTESEFGPFDWVVLTAPAEQARAILPETVCPTINLQDVSMQPCFALMLGYKTPHLFDWDAAFVSNSILSWVSVNSSKPKRGDHFTIVAMSTNEWAKTNFDQSESSVIEAMLNALADIGDKTLADADYIKLKRWKYANAFRQEPVLEMIDESSQLACCGDWCISGRIESAFMSSLTLAKKIEDLIV
ncbi:MAG: NADP transhydrogenase subunit alpha [Methylophilaceae bacterium]|nr:NADP transhydrogenase subunit alpha [Methylophilaceae bacterium]